jgi:hypothetical protein
MGKWIENTVLRRRIWKVNKCIKQCSASSATKEMQIKTTIRSHLTTVRMVIIKKTNNKYYQGCRGKRNPIHCWWECKLMQFLWKSLWSSLKTLKVDLLCNSTIPLFGIHPKECKSIYKTDICTPMFIVGGITMVNCEISRGTQQLITGYKNMVCI